MRKPNQREIDAVIRLPAKVRYEYLAKRVAGNAKLWSLRDESGWCVLGLGDGVTGFPVWPSREFARLYAVDEWAGLEASPIGVHDWLDKWEPGLLADGRLVVVFPVHGQPQGPTMPPDKFNEAIRYELSQIEE